MSLYQPEQQPAGEVDIVLEEWKAAAKRTVTVLEENKAAIHCWFWKALLAINLVLWSVTLCVIAVKALP